MARAVRGPRTKQVLRDHDSSGQDDWSRGYDAGFEAAQEAIKNAIEEPELTLADVAKMTPEEINQNWEAVNRAMVAGR